MVSPMPHADFFWGGIMSDDMDRLEKARAGARKRLQEEIRDKLGVEVDIIEPDDVAIRAGLRALSGMMRAYDRHGQEWPTAPTRERTAKSDHAPIEIEVYKDQPKAHRFARVIDKLELLTRDEHAAADRLQRADEIVHGASTIGGYDGASGGGGYRPGKLEITERQQMAGAFRAAMLVGWTEIERSVIDNFVLERPTPGGDRPLSMVEFGMGHGTRNKQEARAKSRIMIKLVCSRLQYRVAAWDEDQRCIRRENEKRGAA